MKKLLCVALLISSFSLPGMEDKKKQKDEGIKEMDTIGIGFATGALFNALPGDPIILNLAGLGIGTVAYLLKKSKYTAETGSKFGKKSLYALGSYIGGALLVIGGKEVIREMEK